MINNILKYLRLKKMRGYIGGLKSVFENINILDDIVNNNNDQNFTIIEVGSERGVGSTYHLGKYCLDNNLNFITIDPSDESNKSAKNILNKFNSRNLKAVKNKGENYLSNNNIDDILLAYLDGFDVIFPGSIVSKKRINFYKEFGIDFIKDGNRISAEVHLETTKYIYKNIVDGGIIAFDDTFYENDQWFGKGQLAVPFLIENGFNSINSIKRMRDHSILLQKNI